MRSSFVRQEVLIEGPLRDSFCKDLYNDGAPVELEVISLPEKPSADLLWEDGTQTAQHCLLAGFVCICHQICSALVGDVLRLVQSTLYHLLRSTGLYEKLYTCLTCTIWEPHDSIALHKQVVGTSWSNLQIKTRTSTASWRIPCTVL